MWSEFVVYLRLGVTHVADLRGYDHILFIAALCAGYGHKEWNRLLWLATAFTIGHSITLALATLRIIPVHEPLVEVLIPITIVITSLVNLGLDRDKRNRQAEWGKYGMALGFGLIHGMGFSSFLRALLGAEEGIVWPLFAFNVGLEIGQIAIIAVLLSITILLVRLLGILMRSWVLVLSGATLGIAVTLILQQIGL